MLHIIANVGSATGKAMKTWKVVEGVLKENGTPYELHCTEYEGHATELAREISSLPEEHVNLVIVGGDGTINEVINGITDFSKVSVGLVPAGSGNDFARGLKLKGSTRELTQRIIDHASEKNIDLGRLTYRDSEGSRLFAISSGIGMDAIVCKKALTSKLKKVLNRFGLGKLTYLILTVQTIVDMVNTTARITYDDGKTIKYRRMIFTAAMNSFAEGGGVPMAPKASMESKDLSLCTAFAISKFVTIFVLPILVVAKHEKMKCFDIKHISKCRIRLEEAMTVHADGEYCGEHSDIEYECIPGIMRFIW